MKENRRFREEKIREIREREFFEAMERDRDHYDEMRVRFRFAYFATFLKCGVQEMRRVFVLSVGVRQRQMFTCLPLGEINREIRECEFSETIERDLDRDDDKRVRFLFCVFRNPVSGVRHSRNGVCHNVAIVCV